MKDGNSNLSGGFLVEVEPSPRYVWAEGKKRFIRNRIAGKKERRDEVAQRLNDAKCQPG
jgi:hypothetical protein